jgi:oryzin
MLALRFSLVAIPAVLALDPRTYALDEEVVPGRYIVTLKDGADSATVDSHVAWAANVHSRLSRRDERGVNKVWRKNFKGYSGEFSNDTIDEILQSDDVCPDIAVHLLRPISAISIRSRFPCVTLTVLQVVAIEPVTLIAPARAAPASSEQSEIIRQTNATWGLGSISHKSSSTDDPPSDEYLYHKSAGEGMWAYVIDSGIYIEHNDFEGRAHLGYNALADLGVPFEDTNGHGTHCAGTIASKTYGVAKKANLMAVNIFEGASVRYPLLSDMLLCSGD